jgi:LPS sulfotransferase NodH
MHYALHRAGQDARRRERIAQAATRHLTAPLANPASSRGATPTTYVICTTPRSGSWLLSDGLARTRIAGNPREWFNPGEEQLRRAQWRIEHGTDLTAAGYVALAQKLSATPNGVSGTKLHYSQFTQLPDRFGTVHRLRDLAAPEILTRLFPEARYIWLKRKDKTRQAISLLLANQTGEWWRLPEVERPPTEREPSFEPVAVATLIDQLTEQEAGWDAFFKGSGIRPLVIQYDTLVAEYERTIRRVLSRLGLDDAHSIAIRPPRLQAQADERTEEWLRVYRRAAPHAGSARAPAPMRSEASDDDGELEVPRAWRQWLTYAKLTGSSDEAAEAVLVRNGCLASSAHASVVALRTDPVFLGAVKALRGTHTAAWLVDVNAALAQFRVPSDALDRRTALSRDEFIARYYALNRPVVIAGGLASVRAVRTWEPDYLKEVAGDVRIEAMAHRDEDPDFPLGPSARPTEIPLGEFVDEAWSSTGPHRLHVTPRNGLLQRPGTERLRSDLRIAAGYLDAGRTATETSLWFAGARATTPLHYERRNVLLGQIVGRRRYRLFSPDEYDRLYNARGRLSEVDPERPDLIRYPRFRWARSIEVVVSPGDLLFVPVGWWHHARNLDVSVTTAATNFTVPNHYP